MDSFVRLLILAALSCSHKGHFSVYLHCMLMRYILKLENVYQFMY
jgi:hypothetical protein